MSAKHDLVNANLSPEDRFARQNGWLESDGTLSTYGRGALLQFMYEQNKSALVTAVQKARATNEAAEEAITKAQTPSNGS